MAVIDAWDFPGVDGDYATIANPSPFALGHFRTGVSYNPWTIAVIMNVDDVNQAQRGCLFASQRASNDQMSHSVVFEPTNNNYEYQYNAGAIHEPSLTEVNDTWITASLSFAGGTGNVTFRRIPLSTATQSHTSTGASGGSDSADAQPQKITLGAYVDGATVNQELNGQIALILILKGTELSQAELEAWTADPLNYGDFLVSVHGTNCFFWDNSGVDIGGNGFAAPTLSGTVTRGSGNGPDITARSAPSNNTLIMIKKTTLGKVMIR